MSCSSLSCICNDDPVNRICFHFFMQFKEFPSLIFLPIYLVWIFYLLMFHVVAHTSQELPSTSIVIDSLSACFDVLSENTIFGNVVQAQSSSVTTTTHSMEPWSYKRDLYICQFSMFPIAKYIYSGEEQLLLLKINIHMQNLTQS